MKQEKNIQEQAKSPLGTWGKISISAVAVLMFILLVSFAGRQLPYFGNRNGEDTANVSGAMRASRALIVRDTFTAKPGDYLQLWRNSSKLACFDSSAVGFLPALMLNGATRDATYELKVTGDAAFSGTVNAALLNNSGNGVYSNAPTGSAVVFGTINNAGHTLTVTRGTTGGTTFRATDQNIGSNNNYFFVDYRGAVGIGFLGQTPEVRSALVFDVKSTTKGARPVPKMTGAEAEAISDKPDLMQICTSDGNGVQITSKGYWWYDSTAATWNKF